MHKIIFLIFLMLIAEVTFAQPLHLFKEIQQVDSVARTNSTVSHFADLYSKTMRKIEEQLAGIDTATIRQIRKLELNFAGYFIKACCLYAEKGKADTT